MENTKKLIPAPFKTYLLGYYAVSGGTLVDPKTGEVKDIKLDRYELQLLTPTNIEKWGTDKFVGSAVSVINIPFDKAFAFFGVAPAEFSPEKCIDPLVGCPVILHTAPDSKGKFKLRGITADNT